MKKRLILIALFAIFLFTPAVKAGVNISITPSYITVVEGNSVTMTVTVSSSEPFAGLEYNIQYDSSILNLTSTSAPGGGARLADTTPNNETYRMSYTYTFRSRRSGVATISVANERVITQDLTELKIAKNTARVTVITQEELEASYSSNNNLSNLGIVDYTLSPAFDKNTTEYNVTLKPETEFVNIYAIKEDSTSGVYGAGEVKVSEGLNKLKIQVIAENGNVKIYTINATVEELDPIEVKIGNETMYVVRSKKVLEFNNNLFTETTTNINGTEVPAFYNEKTDTTVIGIKNADGLIFYYVVEGNNFYPYQEIKTGGLAIKYLETDKIPYSYTKKVVTIGEYDYNAFVKSETSRYYLIYGINLVTGNKGFYSYDNLENTFQRFDEEELTRQKTKEEETKKVELILGGAGLALFVILFVSTIANIHKNNKLKKQRKDLQAQINELKHNEENNKKIIKEEPKIEEKVETKEEVEPEETKVVEEKELEITKEINESKDNSDTESITQIIESLKREEKKVKTKSKKTKKNDE